MTTPTFPQGNAPSLPASGPAASVPMRHPAPLLSSLLAMLDLDTGRNQIALREEDGADVVGPTELPAAVCEWLESVLTAAETELVTRPAACRECGAPTP